MKSAVLIFAVLFLCGVNCFSQDSATAPSEPSVRRYVTRPLQTCSDLAARAAALTIPTWTATTSGYTYEMVGASPFTAQPSATSTTTISAPVIPVVLTLSDTTVFDPTAPAQASACSAAGTPTALMLSSPLFQASSFATTGTATENDTYPDFFQRANFWNYTSPVGINPGYHMALKASVGISLAVTVPAASGKTVAAKSASECGKLGEVDINWLDNYLTTTGFKTLAANGITPGQLPLFMLSNVVMYDTTASTCCILGYHSATNTTPGIQTYAVADFDTSGRFGTTADVSAFSHEIAEWMDDPLGTNPTPPWGNVGQVTGCQSDLEVGDPLSGTDFTITMSNSYKYHVQELAFLSWFYHQSPSIALNGWYSSNGTFKSFASACSTTRTTLSLNPTTIPAGGSTTVNIAVRGTTALSVPTGLVALVTGSPAKTLATYTLANGAVTNATLSSPPTGSYAVTASYAGDGTYSPSSSAPVTLNVGTATITFSPVSLNFGGETLKTASAPLTVKLTNYGTAALTSVAVSLTGADPGDFSQTNNCGTSVTAGANCTISVIFTPAADGLRTATLSVSDSATGSPQTVPLSGKGSGGTLSFTVSPASLAFGSVNLLSSSAGQTVNISNKGSASLRLFISYSGANPGDFPATNNCPVNLAAGASCSLTVTFKPEATGARTASLNVSGGTTATAAQSAALSGTGVSTGAPAVKLSASSLAFGSEPEGQQSATQTVSLTNSGTGALSITTLSIGGANPHDFIASDNCPSLLAVNASCSISVRLRAIETGSLAATLSVADNATGSPQTVTLTGTGTAPVPSHSH